MLLIVLTFIFGLLVGSFLNVVILRLKSQEDIMLARSHCPKCRTTLQVWDLLPVISFVLLRGRCRYCQTRIAWQYPLIELATASLMAGTTYVVTQGQGLSSLTDSYAVIAWLRDLYIVGLLIVIFVYDLKYYLILDKVTLPAIVILLIINWYLGWPVLDMLLAAGLGGGFFGLQFVLSKGQWIGGGDLRLGVLMGIILSWPNILVGLFLAYIIGAVISLLLVAVKRKTAKSAVPFGTFLTIGTYLSMLFGSQIVTWYLNML